MSKFQDFLGPLQQFQDFLGPLQKFQDFPDLESKFSNLWTFQVFKDLCKLCYSNNVYCLKNKSYNIIPIQQCYHVICTLSILKYV